jgi:site-specific DNA-methyltransferase (adenine-specific)
LQITESAESNGHPCPKPIGVWRKIIARGSVSTDDLLFDPFCGSGTTLVAAKSMNYHAIGIELSERYCEITAKRLAQGSLFETATES